MLQAWSSLTGFPKLLLTAIAILTLIPTAEAIYFKEYQIDVSLNDENKHLINATFIPEENITEIILSIGDEPFNAKVSIDKIGVPATVKGVDGSYRMYVPAPHALSQNVPHHLTIEFITKYRPERAENGFLYSEPFTSDVRVDQYELNVYLPPRATIAFKRNLPLISPAASISTDGQRVHLKWASELDPGESFTAIVVYNREEGLAVSMSIIIFSIVIFIVAGYLIYRKGYFGKLTELVLYKKRKPIAKSTYRERIPLITVRETLTSNENTIVDAIIQSGGRATQNETVHGTGFSKSKVSKVLRGLEMKGVLTKVPYGKTNILKINEKYTWTDSSTGDKNI